MRLLLRVGVVLGAALAVVAGCPDPSACPENQVERGGACRIICNNGADCSRAEQCVDGACMPGGSGGLDGGGGASSSSAGSSSAAGSTGGATSDGASAQSAGTSSSVGGVSGAAASSGGGGASSAVASATGSSGTSSSTGGSSSSSCGVGLPGANCQQTTDCSCGSVCLNGTCTATCSPVGSVAPCPSGQGCTPLDSVNAVCMPTVPRGAACSPSVCAAGLVCEAAERDALGMAIPGTEVCHLPCDYGVTTCSNQEKCLPSTRDGFKVEERGAGAITCDPVNNSSECDTSREYSCETVDLQSVCAKPAAACGVAVNLANLLPLPDGGQRPIPLASVCNLGPAVNVLGSDIPANRFCQDYPNLARPPDVTCRDLIIGAPPGTGLCVAVCRYPAVGARPVDQRDCPTNYRCETATSRILEWVTTTGTMTVPCNNNNDCSAYSEAVCMPGPSGSKFCFRQLGTCQPN